MVLVACAEERGTCGTEGGRGQHLTRKGTANPSSRDARQRLGSGTLSRATSSADKELQIVCGRRRISAHHAGLGIRLHPERAVETGSPFPGHGAAGRSRPTDDMTAQ